MEEKAAEGLEVAGLVAEVKEVERAVDSVGAGSAVAATEESAACESGQHCSACSRFLDQGKVQTYLCSKQSVSPGSKQYTKGICAYPTARCG